MTDKKLVYILDHYPVLSQTFVRNEIEGLRERGYDVLTIALKGGNDVDGIHADVALNRMRLRLVLAICRVLIRNPRRLRDTIRAARMLPLRDSIWLVCWPLVLELIEHSKATHVHTHFALRSALIMHLLSRWTPLNLSVTTHAYDIYKMHSRLGDRLSGLRVLTISQRNADYLTALGIEQPSIVACGVTIPEHASPLAHRRKLVLAVGRLVEKKGFGDLISSWASLGVVKRGWECAIIGDGPLDVALRAESKSVNSGVEFMGSRSNAEVRRLLMDARIVVVPSRLSSSGDVDGIPLVLLEAMAAGCAVVASDVGSISEAMDDSVGWLVPPGGGDRLTDALAQAMSDENEAQSRASRARGAVAHSRSLSAQVDVMEEFFDI